MKKRSRIITIIAICGITMLMLLISQYKNLNAQSDITDKSREKLAYQAKGKKMPGKKRGNLGKKNAGKKGSPRSKNPDANRDKESKGATGFYRAVIENNLFRPLGWRRPNRESQYTLIGTMIEPEGKIAKAFLMEQRSNQYYAVSVGEKVGNATVKKIASNQVTLYKAGEIVTIRAESNQFLSSSGREGGGPRSPNRENRADRNSENRGDKQLDSKEMKKRFQNASPEERKRMLEKFRKTQGNKKEVKGKAKKEKKKEKKEDKGRDDKGKGESKGKVEYRGK